MTSVISVSVQKHVTVVFAVALALCLFLVSAPKTHAATLTTEQIQSVLNLLESFNVESSTIDNVKDVLEGNTPSSSNDDEDEDEDEDEDDDKPNFNRGPGKGVFGGQASSHICTFLENNLSRGSRGDAVAKLQEFLASQGHFFGSTSTFFGPQTEEALKRWQAAQGVVNSGNASSTGWGVLGPKSRSFMARLCNPSSNDGWVRPGPNASSSTNRPSAPTCSLTASDTAVEAGEEVTLTWESTNATHASGSTGNTGTSGSLTVNPHENTIYQKKVYGPGGVGVCQVQVNVGESTDPPGKKTVKASLPAEINLASVAVTTAQMPFVFAVEWLTNAFMRAGVGQ